LDTKLKSNEEKKNWQTLFTFLLILAIVSNGLSSNYGPPRLRAFNEQMNIFETDLYNQISYEIYRELLESKANDKEEVSDQIIEIHRVINESIYWELFAPELDDLDYLELSVAQLDELTRQYVYELVVKELQSFQQLLPFNFQNLNDAASYQTGAVILNGHEQLHLLASGTSSLNDLEHSYNHLMMIRYDELGQQTISSTLNVTEFIVRQNIVWPSSQHFSWKPIKETVFVFAIPFNLVFSDQISEFQNVNFLATFVDIMSENHLIAVGVISALALLIPVQSFKKFNWFKRFLDGSLEFVLILGVVVIWLIFGMMPHTANTINHVMLTAQTNFLVRLFLRLLNTSIWLCLLSIITIIILYLKHVILNKKELHSVKLIKQTDFRDPLTKKLKCLMGIQFLLISIMCLAGVCGVAIALVYSSLLFLLLKKYLTKTQQDYLRILEIFNNISEQNGKVITDEHLSRCRKLNLLQKMEQNLSHLNISLNQLHELTLVGPDQNQLNLQPVDLVNLIQEVITEVAEQIGQTKVMLRTQFPKHLPLLKLDIACMRQVFTQLLLNTETYGLSGTRAYIDIIEKAEIVQIMFRNISASEIDQSADMLMSQQNGSLNRIRSCVKLHGGTFDIKLDGDLFKVIISLNKDRQGEENHGKKKRTHTMVY